MPDGSGLEVYASEGTKAHVRASTIGFRLRGFRVRILGLELRLGLESEF